MRIVPNMISSIHLGVVGFLPVAMESKLPLGGSHWKTFKKKAVRTYATSRPKNVQWAIIHFGDEIPVRRILNIVMDILMKPTETKKTSLATLDS